MTDIIILLAVLTALGSGLAAGRRLPARRNRDIAGPGDADRRILLPFTGTTISRRAVQAAIRLARAENAVIMPTFLARVPRQLPIDAPLPVQCLKSMPLLEAIEQKATAAGVQVDARVGRGRSYRDALQQVIEAEPVDRIIVSATTNPRTGLDARDLQWLLEKAPSEVLILRPGPDDSRAVTAAAVKGHF